jgi:hypothetical protein
MGEQQTAGSSSSSSSKQQAAHLHVYLPRWVSTSRQQQQQAHAAHPDF